MEWAAWVSVVVSVAAALGAFAAARRAQSASGRATDAAALAQLHGEAARRRAEAAAQQASFAKEQARAVATTVDEAREQLALAHTQAGNVGAVDVEWVQEWRHGPVFGLLRVQAVGHHALHDVHLSIVAPRRLVGGVPAVAFLGDSPVDMSAAEERIGLPQGGDTSLANVMRADVPAADLRPGTPWHALVMCLSEAGTLVLVVDWAVGPARDRERARVDLPLPAPLPSSGSSG